jgi:hypothetical protein
MDPDRPILPYAGPMTSRPRRIHLPRALACAIGLVPAAYFITLAVAMVVLGWRGRLWHLLALLPFAAFSFWLGAAIGLDCIHGLRNRGNALQRG